MIDFAALVLGPAMAVFGQAITVTPTRSQPGAAAYAARGVYASKPVAIPIEGTDDVHQTVQPTLGIRLADFATVPVQGDGIAMAGGAFVIFNVIPDGQGGADLVLRSVA